MMTTPQHRKFLRELAALLQKYDVSINFVVGECSDTHGLHGERITIETNDHDSTEIISVDGWSIYHQDILDELCS